MDPETYNQMIAQALFGGAAPYGAPANSTTWPMPQQSSQAAMPGQTGQTGAGMLGTPAPTAGGASQPTQAAPQQQMPAAQPAQGSWGAFAQTMAPYTANAYPQGQNPFQLAGNQQMMQPFSSYPGMNMPPPTYGQGGGGGAQ